MPEGHRHDELVTPSSLTRSSDGHISKPEAHRTPPLETPGVVNTPSQPTTKPLTNTKSSVPSAHALGVGNDVGVDVGAALGNSVGVDVGVNVGAALGNGVGVVFVTLPALTDRLRGNAAQSRNQSCSGTNVPLVLVKLSDGIVLNFQRLSRGHRVTVTVITVRISY